MTHAVDEGAHRQLKDTVYQQLRDDIISGVLLPGAVLREAELAPRFGVSKTPLRDALVRLQKDGFVAIPPYRSAVVVGYSRTDLREIYELRELLEGACARQAASYISADGLAELARIVQASAACVAGGEVIEGRAEELAELHDQFDLVMYAQSRNSRIAEMVGNIRGHIKRIGRLTAGIPGRLAKSVPEHQAIYEAIVQRDGGAAEALMRRHILSVMADQLTSIAETSTIT
ncbi:MAG: GntR family transcriptional regulator [Actinobacteria bacterium]|nr:GntR family transcriptional regulator [Actinomycetota bacterium]